jgi:phage/plasmid-associated DNA primase
LANDRFTLPVSSQKHLASLAELTNPVGAMLEECVERYDGADFLAHYTPCDDMYDLWKAWCSDNLIRTSLSKVGFGMKLSRLDRPLVRKQIQDASRKFYVYYGVGIRPAAMERYLKR